MTGIDRLSGSTPLTPLSAGQAPAASVATGAMGEIGHRVLAWVGASAGNTSGTAAWADATGRATAFSPDAGELARGGDVYGLRGIADDIVGQLGGTPTQAGDLHRALEDFTRAAVVQFAGLAGAPGDRQVAGVRDAIAGAVSQDGGASGLDGVIGRIDAAAGRLAAENRG